VKEAATTTVEGNVVGLARLPGTQVELLCKAKSDRRIKGLVPAADLNLSLQWAEKGSYRTENILTFLRRWLDPWTPQRASSNDYRILMLDVARSHLHDDVIDFAFSRGFAVLPRTFGWRSIRFCWFRVIPGRSDCQPRSVFGPVWKPGRAWSGGQAPCGVSFSRTGGEWGEGGVGRLEKDGGYVFWTLWV